MRALGVLLMLSGWLIVIAASFVLRGDASRLVFAVAGIAVQALGLGILAWTYHSIVQHASAA